MLLKPPLPPMEARLVEQIPAGLGWQYEPKWDGFRCIAFRDWQPGLLAIEGRSATGALFSRYHRCSRQLPKRQFVLDGELVVPVRGALSFDELQLRLHPAASRVQKLAAANPAMYLIFDLLADAGRSHLTQPLRERRQLLEKFARLNLKSAKNIRLSPATTNLQIATQWFKKTGGDLDGIIAKRLDAAYASGERTAAVKIKQIRSGRLRRWRISLRAWHALIGSLLLGLYGDDGLLHHVGFTSAFTRSERRELTKKFEALKKRPGFTGNAPGSPSRWSTDRTGEWEPVAPRVVAEVAYDHFTGGRFRHGTKFLRWRSDKAPRQCPMDQVVHREGKSLALLQR
jgi:ATP-dependent DNA ligase